MLILGHLEPSGIVSATGGDPSVHGHPSRSGGGLGRSIKTGERVNEPIQVWKCSIAGFEPGRGNSGPAFCSLNNPGYRVSPLRLREQFIKTCELSSEAQDFTEFSEFCFEL